MRFLGKKKKKKKIAKTAQFWSQNVLLVPFKKLNTHTLWFHPQIKELSALLCDQIAVQSRSSEPSFAVERLPEERTVRASVLRM